MSTHVAHETKEIFCCRCRSKTLSAHLEHKTLKNGKAAVSGKCEACGCKTYTIVKGATKKPA